jgi:predicted TPR repeat methyltransferase
VALAPANANCFGTRAEIHEKLGQRDAAIADFRTALALDTSHQSAADGLKRLGATP